MDIMLERGKGQCRRHLIITTFFLAFTFRKIWLWVPDAGSRLCINTGAQKVAIFLLWSYELQLPSEMAEQ